MTKQNMIEGLKEVETMLDILCNFEQCNQVRGNVAISEAVVALAIEDQETFKERATKLHDIYNVDQLIKKELKSDSGSTLNQLVHEFCN